MNNDIKYVFTSLSFLKKNKYIYIKIIIIKNILDFSIKKT